MKIIETNLSCDKDDNIKDHQSRIIEVPTWDEYIDLFQNYEGEHCGDYPPLFGDMIGCGLPSLAEITSLNYDEFHLRCRMKLWSGFITIKLAYLIREETNTPISSI